MISLQVNRLHHPVVALGPGRRAGIWTQGCSIGCRGCASLDTWEPDPARAMAADDVVAWLASLPEDELDGVTITGGEPFDQPDGLGALLQGIAALRRTRKRPLDVLCYSGRPLRIVRRDHPELLQLLDAVVTGPYLRDRPTDLLWRGSENQELVPLSDLGRERYAPYADRRTDRPVVQVAVDDGVWLIGIPRRGDLERLEAGLEEAGVVLTGASWHS